MKLTAAKSKISGWTRTRLFAVVVLCLILVAGLAFTLLLSRVFHRRVDAVSRKWFRIAEEQVHAGNPAAAVESYRTALIYSRDNRRFRLRLGEALAAAGHDKEAAAYLTTLWDREPGSGRLSLQLARLMARAGDERGAQQYFHGAIYGVWDSNADHMRLTARTELIEFLLSRDLNAQAEAELIALLPELPKDPAVQKDIAAKFMRTGDFLRALTLYSQLLSQNRTDAEALRGAGRAAFELGRYSSAASFLRRIPEATRGEQLEQTLAVAEAMLRLNPYTVSSSRERAQRVVRAFEVMGKRLKACSARTDAKGQAAAGEYKPNDLESKLSTWSEMRRDVTVAKLRRSPETMESVLNFVLDAEQATTKSCGRGSAEDRALFLLGQQRETAE